MRGSVSAVVGLSLLLAACGNSSESVEPASSASIDVSGNEGAPVEIRHSDTFRISRRDAFWVVDLQASIATWGGKADGPEQRARVLLVPRGEVAPPLTGEFANAQVIRIPVRRIVVNLAPFEAMLTALGVDDRLVAVGGPKSYNDAIRQRVMEGALEQIGYGWHMPPILDALLASKPEVLLMAMGDLSHSSQMDRIRQLGIPVFPMFINSETHYMGRVEYIRLVGLLTGREDEANAHLAMVEQAVAEWKALSSTQPTRSVISAWYSGSGRWMATVRNSDAALLRDANGRNLLEEPDDPRRDEYTKLGTEQMLVRGADADCAILRDNHSQPYGDHATLNQFRAFREGCIFAITGMAKPEVDAYDYYERAVIRPDWLLADLVRMLHPELRGDEPFNYIQPDSQFYESL